MKRSKIKIGCWIALIAVIFSMTVGCVPTTSESAPESAFSEATSVSETTAEKTSETTATTEQTTTKKTTVTSPSTATKEKTKKTTIKKIASTVAKTTAVKTTVKKTAAPKTTKLNRTGDGRTVYIAPNGKRYHFDPDCAGKNGKPTSVQQAQEMGLTPCKKCAGG